MNIYCIRDRMLDYFQDPFVSPNDYNTLASVANAINNPEATSAIAQAPHHFEIWRIGTVDDQGTLRESRQFLSDCSALVRAAPDAGREAAQRSAKSAAETAPQQTGSLNGAQLTHPATEQTPRDPPPPKRPAARKRAQTARRGSN